MLGLQDCLRLSPVVTATKHEVSLHLPEARQRFRFLSDPILVFQFFLLTNTFPSIALWCHNDPLTIDPEMHAT